MAPQGVQSPQPTARDAQARTQARTVGQLVLVILAASLVCNCVLFSTTVALLGAASGK